MITIGRKLWKNLEDDEKIAHCEKLFEEAKGARQRYDLEWYMNYMFLDGNHYTYYNTTTNTIEQKPRRKSEVRLVINKIRSSIRAIQNYSTRFNPKWEVMPGDEDKETLTNARRSGKLLDYIYRTLHLEVFIQSIVDSVLNTSVAFAEIDWNDTDEGGRGQVKIFDHDSFDISIDPRSIIYKARIQGRFIAKAISKELDDIKSDERYDEKARKQVKSDSEIATSQYKTRLIEKREGGTSMGSKNKATVKEFQLWDYEGNEEGGNIQLFTYAGGKVLRDEALPLKEYNIYVFQVPQDTKRVYHRSWTADAVPLNKALDRIESQKVMYVNQALRYRIIAEKGSGVEEIDNTDGSILEVNVGRTFKQMEMYPYPSAADNLTNEMSGFIDSILGANDASLGRMPVGARSGKVLEALQAADANNLANIRLALESFLSVIGSKILDVIAEKYQSSRVYKLTEAEDGQEYGRFIGSGAEDEAKRKDATVINKDNEVIVKIGSWLGHTVEARRETLIDLATQGFIPREEVLRQFEFPNVADLSEKARVERNESDAMKANIAGRGKQQGQLQAPTKPEGQTDPMIEMADEENTLMMNGQQLPPTEGATPEHTQAHIDFVQSQYFTQSGNDGIAQIFIAHIKGEQQLQGATPTGNGMI